MIQKLNASFDEKLQQRIAYLAIGRSTLRNQGAKGLVSISRSFLKNIDLKRMAALWNRGQFLDFMDSKTKELMSEFPEGAKQNFGAARKALCIFCRDIIYSHFLVKNYGFKISPKHLSQLELPLDKDTSTAIWRSFPELKTEWKGIKYLTETTNILFQKKAAEIAKFNKTIRIHLDTFFWREGK